MWWKADSLRRWEFTRVAHSSYREATGAGAALKLPRQREQAPEEQASAAGPVEIWQGPGRNLAGAPVGWLQEHHVASEAGRARSVGASDPDVAIQIDHFRRERDGAAVDSVCLDKVLIPERRRQSERGAINAQQLDLLRLAGVIAQHCHEWNGSSRVFQLGPRTPTPETVPLSRCARPARRSS